VGRHVEGFPNTELRGLIAAHSIFRRLRAAGRACTFANAYVRGPGASLPLAHRSVTTVMTCEALGVTRQRAELEAGRAVFHDITRASAPKIGVTDLPVISEKAAAGHLLNALREVDFCLFEYFLTDHAGHRGDLTWQLQVLATVDCFLAALQRGIDQERELILVVSDHGNIESRADHHHTANPVPWIAFGCAEEQARENCRSLMDVTPKILALLGVEESPEPKAAGELSSPPIRGYGRGLSQSHGKAIMRPCHFVWVCLLAGIGWTATAAELPERAREGLDKACTHWAGTVASHGGFVWEYSTDLVTRRRGESKDLPASTVWVQTGTPMVGEAFLAAYRATGEKAHLEAALAAGRCLAYGQLESGGWTYSIEFDPELNRHHYHHLDKGSNTTTFDDDNTQSATRFLMRLDQYVDDPEITAAVDRAIACFLKAQYSGGNWDGAWPQRYPPPEKGYGGLPTFNDNTMSDCVETMLLAADLYDRQDCLDAVKRCLEFYLRSQQPAPQASWAQQCDRDLKPAWARKFEPPSITGSESVGH
jgi:hypothetical protein